MEKLYFLAPNVDSAAAIVADLRRQGISDSRIHLIASDRIALEQLPQASVLEGSDLMPALQRGAAIGGAAGLLAGLASVAFPPAGLVFGGGALLVSTAGGATFGAWTASMIGSSVDNSHLREFEEALQQGQVLLLVETDADDVAATQRLIKQHHPEASIHGAQDTVPPAL